MPEQIVNVRPGQSVDFVVRTPFTASPTATLYLTRAGSTTRLAESAGVVTRETMSGDGSVVTGMLAIPADASPGDVLDVWAIAMRPLPMEEGSVEPAWADVASIEQVRGWTLRVEQPAPQTSSGDGDLAVNHDTGGADNLRFVDPAGIGIDGAKVIAYLASDYAAGTRKIIAQTFTGSDGRWLEDLYLDAGTYRFVFILPGIRAASKEQEIA